jgi:hypothetical protein
VPERQFDLFARSGIDTDPVMTGVQRGHVGASELDDNPLMARGSLRIGRS